MYIQDIVRRVREAAGDSGVIQFSNDTLTDWINDGIRACVEENSLLQGRGTAQTIAGKYDYNLPSDIFKIHSVFVGGNKLPVLTLSEWEDRSFNNTDSGNPAYAMIYAGVLTLYPVPSEVQDLVINYTKSPTEIKRVVSGSEEAWSPNSPGIPDAFHSRIVTYCLAQVAFQDDNYEKYQALMSEFRTGVADLKHLKDQTENLYPSIHYVEWDEV